MEPISRNKKIAIIGLVICILTVLGLLGTGKLSFSVLKSDVLNQVCTEQSQKNNLPQYTTSLTKRDQAQKTIDIASGEILVLKKQISDQIALIKSNQQQMNTKNAKIVELDTFLEKNCTTSRALQSNLCKTRKQQRKDLTQDVQILKNAITISNNAINQFTNQINNKQRLINQHTQIITRLSVFINAYDSCDKLLKIKPLLTSPLMSGEAMISGETLVSGEVILIGKTLVSGEVLMSGEPCVSGEVRVPLYRLAVTLPASGKSAIDSMNFDMAFGNPNTIQLTDYYITEEGNPALLYKCTNTQNKLSCVPGVKGVVNGETKHYILSAKLSLMTGTGSLKVYGGNIAYNGGKIDAINQTTRIKINYAPKPVKTDIKYVSQFGKLGTNDGEFNNLYNISLDSSDNIYTVEYGNNRIQKFDKNGKFLMKFGTPGTGDGQLHGPRAISVDSIGNIYVATYGNDGYDNHINKFDKNGKFLMRFGTLGVGDGQFRDPVATSMDSSDNIYIVDLGNNRIQKFDKNGKFLMKFGTKGAGDGQLDSPQDIVLDTSGNIYIADFANHRIQKFDKNGKFLMKFGTKGVVEGQLNYPNGVSIDSSGYIYTTEFGNDRIQKFDASGKFLMKFGMKGTGNGQFNTLQDIGVDSSGNIYVLDYGNSRVQKLSQVASCGNEKPVIVSVGPKLGTAGTMITIFGSGFKATSTVLIGDNISEVIPVNVSPDGRLLGFRFPQSTLIKFPADTYSLRVSNLGNVSIASGLASNSVLFSILNDNKPSITVLSPNSPGLTFKLGDDLPYNVEVKNAVSKGSISIFMTEKNTSDWLTGKNYFSSTGFGYDPKLQNPISASGSSRIDGQQPGLYYILAQWKGDDGSVMMDFSDNSFKLVSGQMCPQFMPPPGGWCNGGTTIPGGIDTNGCALPPTCQPNTCPVFIPVVDGWCNGGTLLTLPQKSEDGCDYPTVCILP